MSHIPNIILDTDLGTCTDDVFALHGLFAARKWGLCDIVGIMQSRKHHKSKDLLDRFLHYYGADDIPLGLVEGEEQYFEITPYYQLADALKPNGTPLFEPTGIPLSERLPAWKLYRKLLSEAADGSITIVSIGMFTNLGNLLKSGPDEYSPLPGRELVREKVRSLELMAGCFTPIPLRFPLPGATSNLLEIEYNIGGDVPLAKMVVEGWPGTVNLLPIEAGMPFPSEHDKILKQYEWQPDSPIYQIYSRYDEWEKGDVGQYLWDIICLYHALAPGRQFETSDRGIISIDDRGMTTFTPDASGNARVIGINDETDIRAFIDRVSTYFPRLIDVKPSFPPQR